MLNSFEKMVQTSTSESEMGILKSTKDSFQSCLHGDDKKSFQDQDKSTSRTMPEPGSTYHGRFPSSVTGSNVCKCNCHAAQGDSYYDRSLTDSLKFRDLLLLHLDIIEEQSMKLKNKEKIIQQLKTDNDQVSCFK